MNRVKRAAHLYELGQGYVRAWDLEERRKYGDTSYYQRRGRSTVKKVRWYHKLWHSIEEFFSSDSDSQQGGAKKKKAPRAGTKAHWNQHAHKVRNFSRRRM